MKKSLPKFNKNNIKILFESENYLVVDKPAGLLVYLPNGAPKETTLAEIFRDSLNFQEYSERTGIIHRLDRDTSGAIVLAKNENAEELLKAEFKNRNIKKIYTVLVWGRPKSDGGVIDIPLGRGAKDRLRVVPKKEGRQSLTEFNLLKYFPKSNTSLLEINLKTGRTHQVRVHMAAIGNPVVGDAKYSNKKTTLSRQFLHASKIEFTDPIDGKKVSVSSELPEELNFFLKNQE